MVSSRVSVLLAVAVVLLSVGSLSVGADSGSTSGTSANQNYYHLLGSTQADVAREPSVLKKTYRKLALQHHPDKATSEDDKANKQATFVKLSQAYEILSDPRTKARYDYLLSQGTLEYDSNRDWSDFDVSQGFKRLPKTAAQKAAANDRKAQEAKFREAQEIFRKAAEEAEEFALWTALSIAFGIALLPAIYMWFARKADAITEEKKRKERSSDLKANQAALIALQEEQEAARKLAQEEDRQYARELREAREEAAREAAAAAASSSSPAAGGDEGSWEVVDPAGAEVEKDDKSEDSSEEEVGGKTLIRCVPCKKSFKSQQQMDNHEQSNQHKKALKELASGKKKSRRDE